MIDQTAQRTMQVPGQGIVPQGRPTTNHQEYPKMMTHPQFQPGKPGPEVKSPHGFTYHTGGTPIRFPPVLVRTPDQEEYHKSLGYETVGKSDPDAFNRAVGAGQIPDHVAYEPLEYPKWVQGKLVNSREEEERLFPPSEPVDRDPALNTEVPLVVSPLDGSFVYDDTPKKSMEQLEIEDLKAKVDQLTKLLAKALAEVGPLIVDDVEQPEGIIPRKGEPKKARKKVVRTAQQKRDHSAAIKAGLARKRALTESNSAEEGNATPVQ